MSKKAAAALFFCAVFALFCCGVRAQPPAQHNHVVFVVTSADHADWQTAMVLADHFLAGVKPEPSDVEVLAYGPGIEILKAGSPTAASMAGLQKLGVHFVACENAMKAFHITKADLLPGVTTVPSGVVELVHKQEAGWSYVKVGS